jgi:hypothetical protein
MSKLIRVRRLDGRMDPVELDLYPYLTGRVIWIELNDPWLIDYPKCHRLYIHPDYCFQVVTATLHYRNKRPNDTDVHPLAGQTFITEKADEIDNEEIRAVREAYGYKTSQLQLEHARDLTKAQVSPVDVEVRISFDKDAIVIDGERHVVKSSYARSCFRKVVEANGKTVLSKDMPAARPGRLFKALPDKVKATFEHSGGHGGGARLHREYCRPEKSIKIQRDSPNRSIDVH